MSSTTLVRFENAAVSEAVKRLSKVAPTKGEAFDKASGILIEVYPGQPWPVIMKATNLSLYYMEWVGTIESAGEKVSWRVSSEIFSQIITRLPIGSGKTVEFTEEGNKLQIKSGRFKASIGLIKAGYYPEWGPFDPAQTAPVEDLGARLDQVAWATDKRATGDALGAIRLDGECLVATDRLRLARVPCVAEHITEAIVFPPSTLSSLINANGITQIGTAGDQLLVSPNEFTQIRCVAYGATYPNVERIMSRDYPNSIKVNKTEFVDAVGRVSAADSRSRVPQMTMFFGNEAIALYVEEETGTDKSIDVLEYPGQAVHALHKVFMSQQSIIDAMTASPSDYVEIFYDPTNPARIIRLTGDSGYEAWLSARSGIRNKEE